MTEFDQDFASIPDPSETLEDAEMIRDLLAAVGTYLAKIPDQRQEILKRFFLIINH